MRGLRGAGDVSERAVRAPDAGSSQQEAAADPSGASPAPGFRLPPSSYAERAAAHEADHDVHARRAELLSWLRVLVFLGGVVLLGLGLAATGPGVAVFSVGLVLLVALFTGLARAQRAAERRAAWHRALAAVCEEGTARAERRWDRLPVTPAAAPDPGHPYAGDLGVVGRASLLQLVGPVGPSTGAPTLLRWLLAPAPADVVRARQAAVAELAPLTGFREELAARARLAGRGRAGDVERFLQWAEAEPWLAGRPALRAARWALPAFWAALGGLVAQGLVPAGAFALALLAGVLVSASAGRRVLRLLGTAAPGSASFRLYAEQLTLAVRPPLRAPELARLQGVFMGGGSPAALHLRRLRRALDAAELRYSPLLHAVVNVLTAWDLHVLATLERWQRRAGRQARAWFVALGELEAIAALATLQHDHPDWTLPELDERADRVEGEALGHPLLAPAACVRNDVVVGPPGTFLFVTGSNMAGKSTLLRAIGANTVLAQAGGPVCARRLRLPPVALLTSMRVSDSLEEGLSFFMAELMRLKSVVEAARQARPVGGCRALYLLDEILQGTNSAERQVAARRILEHLLAEDAIGAVSTHDLGLAETPALQPAARPVHFRETLAGGGDGAPVMTFDYVLRPGPATSANALALVRMMGLG